jgi:hypothetical protein
MDTNLTEIWLPIKDYEGFYEVSNLGRVRSVSRIVKHSRGGGKIVLGDIKSTSSTRGHLRVHLYKHGVTKSFFVHRLVAIAFIPNHENKPSINHINCVRGDNRVENLEWCTSQENENHKKSLGRQAKGTKIGLSKLNDDAVRYIRKNYIKGKNTRELAEKFGVAVTQIKCVARRLTWKHI